MNRMSWPVVSVCLALGLGAASAQTTLVSNLKLDLGSSGAQIRDLARQADGKLIVAGNFNLVDGVPRSYLARLNADGSLDAAWNPNANSDVRDVALIGTNIYVSGGFTSIGGQSRRFLAKLDATTGAADPAWDPNPLGYGGIYDLSVSGTNLYVAGDFTNLCGQTRNRLARLDESGALDALWNPDANGAVYVLAVAGTNLYAGGSFTSIGGQLRNRIARLNDTNGMADAWNPDIKGGEVLDLVPSGTNVYAAGAFTLAGVDTRNRLAKLSTSDGVANPDWDPDAGLIGAVRKLVVNGADVYAGGSFLTLGGESIPYLAKLNDTDGAPDTGWQPDPSYDLYALLLNGASLYVGGSFSSLGGELSRAFARLEVTTAQPDPAWGRQFYIRGKANCFGFQSDGKVIVGGVFVTAAGEPRTNIARLNADGTLDAAWKPNANAEVSSLLVDGTNLYAGGWFTAIGGQARTGFARLAYDHGGLVTNGVPETDGYVLAMARSGEHLYIGGWFSTMGGEPRANAVKLRASDGALDAAWLPEPDSRVSSLAVNGSDVFLAGMFWNVGGQERKYVAKVNAASGAADPLWNAGTERRVYCLSVYSNQVYVGGEITNIGGFVRGHIARLNTTNGDADPAWNPDASATVEGLAASDSGIYATGSFTNIGGLARRKLARLNATTGAALADWDFGLSGNNPIEGLAVNGRFLWVGGYFYEAGGLPRAGVAAIETAYAPVIGAPARAGVGATTASLGGTVFDTMGAAVTERGVYWSLTNGFTPPAQGTRVAEAGAFGTGVFTVAVSGLTPAATHYFKAFAVNPLGTSYAAQASFQALPGTPSDVSASDGLYADRVSVSWTASAGAATYEVWRHTADDAAGAERVAAGLAGTSCEDATPAPVQVYFYWVKAVNGAVTSLFSASDSGYRTPVVPPAAPSGLAATDGAFTDRTRLTWNALADASGYLVWRGPRDHAASASLLGATAAAAYDDTTGDADTLYYYWVQATNSVGASGLSPSDSGYRASAVAVPPAPSGLAATDGAFADRVRVTWNGVAQASGYVVLRNITADAGGAATLGATAATDWDDLTAAADTVYYYWVRATNAAGASTVSASDTGFCASAVSAPAAPAAVAASRGVYPDRIRVSWARVGNAAGYDVFRGTNDASGAAALAGRASATNWDDTTMLAGQRYYFWVRATNAAGASALAGPGLGWATPDLPAMNDYNGDRASDLAVFDNAGGSWYAATAGGAPIVWAAAWGWPGALPVTGDYDADGISDLAVFDTTTGCWYILTVSGTLVAWATPWGWPGAWPVSGDYDGDAVSDLAVFDTLTGNWYVLTVSGAVVAWATPWGWPGAWPVSGDYDGDGVSDLAVFDTLTGNWYVLTVSGTVVAWATPWGWPGAWPVSGDYDGDGVSDLAVFDTTTGYWYAYSLTEGVLTWSMPWGWPGAWPIGGDYDGDGVSDLAVFDTLSGNWYVYSLSTVAPIAWAQPWGWPGARPVSSGLW